MSTHKNYSEATAVEIDVEIKRIIDENYSRVYRLLSDNVDTLHKISLELIEKENLSGEEVDRIIGVEPKAALAPTPPADDSVTPA